MNWEKKKYLPSFKAWHLKLGKQLIRRGGVGGWRVFKGSLPILIFPYSH
jgi:hypothetical protein